MTSKLAALAKILLLPRRSAPAFVIRPLQRIFGTTTTDEIRTEPQENDDDDEEQLEEQQQQPQNKGILLEALLMTRRGSLYSNPNYTKYHKGEQVSGPITDPIAKHQLREVRNEYYKSAAINNNNYNNDNDDNSNFNFNFNTQRRRDDQDTPPASSSSSWSSVSSPTSSSQDVVVVVSRTTPDLSSTIPVGDEYLYLAQ